MVLVTKANGATEEFSEKKLRNSVIRAGIPTDMQKEVMEHVVSHLRNNIPTAEIYQHIIEFLEKKQPFAKAKYSLKRSLMDMGPTGYPFEDYLAQLLIHEGYKAKTRTILQGKCITHEIDVIAQKGNETVMVEAKFHNSVGIKTDVHVALYTKARFDDVKEKNNFTKAFLITNTKATTDAISYAQCVGMDIMTWDYPEGNSLRDLVEKYALYPITALSTLPQNAAQTLLEKSIVLSLDVCRNPELLDSIGLSEEKKKQILNEAQMVCKKAGSYN